MGEDSKPIADLWAQRVGARVIGLFLFMLSGFLFFIGTYGQLQSSNPTRGLINKGILGAPVLFYGAVLTFFAPPDSLDGDEPGKRRWMYTRVGFGVGSAIVEALVLFSWVTYLHHHGFPTVF